MDSNHGIAVPILKVSICNRYFPAILDNGSSISLISQEVIELVRQLNITTTPSELNIAMASGGTTAYESVLLTVGWPGGKRRQKFRLLPDLVRPVLLGRDFIGAAQITACIHLGGWFHGSNFKTLVPFDGIDYGPFFDSNAHDVPLTQAVSRQTKIHSMGGKVEEPLIDSTSFLCPGASAVGHEEKSSAAVNE